MMILGLTGSIGMGKSTAADNFRRLGIPVHDADKAVHELLAENGEAAPRIKDLFPDTVNKGTLDRELIAKKVFANAQALARIEEILHPIAGNRRSWAAPPAREGPWSSSTFRCCLKPAARSDVMPWLPYRRRNSFNNSGFLKGRA